MSLGLAKEFLQKCGNIQKLKDQNPELYKTFYIKDNKRYIICQIIKENHFDKPDHKMMFISLFLREFYLKNHIEN